MSKNSTSQSQVGREKQIQKKPGGVTEKGQHNDLHGHLKLKYPSQLFAYFYSELVSTLIKDCDLLVSLTDSVTDNILRHPVDKEKIRRHSRSIIGCKMLASAVLMYLHKSRYPDHVLCNLLFIFESNEKLMPLVGNMRRKATQFNIELKEICDVQLDLLLSEARESQPAAKCIQKFQSSFQLPPDPKCSLMVSQGVPEFIPLDKASLKGESPIGQTSPLSIDELCNVPPSSWILLEGVSGIGKSTLAYEMLKQWKDGTALQQYSCVLLLRLRNENVHQQWSPSPDVPQLIEDCLNEQYIEPPEIKSILDDKGHNLLLILEGYDELPKGKFKFQMEVFRQLKSDFHNAVVAITIHPSFLYQLSENILFTKEIEILGFNKSSQNRYIEIAFKNDKDKIEEFTESIKSCPIIAQYLNVPLHLAIMIKIASSSSQKPLPQTITELYKSFVMILICRQSKIDILDDLDSLPLSEKSIFQKICELALEDQIVFDCDDSNTLGLMKREFKIEGKDVHMKSSSFLHSTIKNFLAAYQMQTEEKKLFKSYRNNRQFSTTMHFLAGLTELQESFDTIKFLGEHIFHLDQFHHLMELKNDASVSKVLNKNKMIEVSRISRAITLQDFYVLGRCFGLSSCSWKLGFTIRGLSSEHIKMFVSGFNDVMPQSQQQQHPSLEHVVFSLNPIGNEGLATFLSLPPSILCTISEFFLRAALLKNGCFKSNCLKKFEQLDALKIFLFHDNEFNKGEQQQLIDVLCALKHLEKVSFSNLSPQECFTLLSQSHLTELELYELSLESVEELLISLTQCMTLECIELYQSPITKETVERSLQHSLPHCTLKELKLINCEIDSKTANLIIDAATYSPTLQVIDLSDNVIDDEGGCYIASKMHAVYQKLLPNPAKNIMQLFLQHNCFTETSIKEFTYKLIQLPYTFTIHLSLQWKDYIKTKLRHVEELLLINVQNDNLVLQARHEPQHGTQAPSATDGTNEDDTESGWNKVKKKRRGRPSK